MSSAPLSRKLGCAREKSTELQGVQTLAPPGKILTSPAGTVIAPHWLAEGRQELSCQPLRHFFSGWVRFPGWDHTCFCLEAWGFEISVLPLTSKSIQTKYKSKTYFWHVSPRTSECVFRFSLTVVPVGQDSPLPFAYVACTHKHLSSRDRLPFQPTGNNNTYSAAWNHLQLDPGHVFAVLLKAWRGGGPL